MSGPWNQRDEELEKLNKQDRELDHKSQELARRIWEQKQRGDASKEEIAELEEQLEQTVVEHFEVRQKKRLRQLELLRKELDKAAELIEKRESRRDAIIQRRLNQLLGKKDELEF